MCPSFSDGQGQGRRKSCARRPSGLIDSSLDLERPCHGIRRSSDEGNLPQQIRAGRAHRHTDVLPDKNVRHLTFSDLTDYQEWF